MARTPRCLVDDLDAEPLRLSRDSVHHLQRVLRLRPGDDVELIDGSGGLARARWQAGGELRAHERLPLQPAPANGPRLFVAAPKGARLDVMVEKSVELGALELRLLRTEFSGPLPNEARWERMRRKADEALLQCRGLHRLQLGPPLDLGAALALQGPRTRWFGSAPIGANTTAAGISTPRPENHPLDLLIGPEGGWSPEELLQLSKAGASPVSLGQRVLRVETAALALLALAAAGSAAPDPRQD
ncbi:MAG: ribosomal RNA small subunit methyltransferase E [Planctomycetota bacterium]|nr:MAG: ribosomal RNA small subunit methyltransferase E [Planctomycetota bacterium]